MATLDLENIRKRDRMLATKKKSRKPLGNMVGAHPNPVLAHLIVLELEPALNHWVAFQFVELQLELANEI